MQDETHNSTKPSSSSEGPSHHRPLRRNKPHLRTRREVSAGGIIVRSAKEGLEVFFIRDPFGKYAFPKGHPKMGETLAETAVREIREETGLTGLRFVAPLGRIWLIFRRNKTVIHKTVHMFLFEAPLHAKEKFSGQEGITGGGWFPIQEALKMRGYKNLDQLLTKALRITAGPRRKNSSITPPA